MTLPPALPVGTEICRDVDGPLVPTGDEHSPGTTPHDLLLQRIQGNILKGHGRAYTRLILFWFDDDTPPEACRQLLREAYASMPEESLVTTAYQQWLDARAKEARGTDRPFFSVGLSISGLRRCGYVNNGDLPLQGAEGADGFTDSMRRTFRSLEKLPSGDPGWDAAYYNADGPHGVWLLAHENPAHELEAMSDRVLQHLRDHGAHSRIGATEPVVEKGMKWTDALGQAREPFGFADGISDPPFFAKDFSRTGANYYTTKWVNLPRSQVLLQADPGQDPQHDGGSFLVLRKLEQLVEAFRQWERTTGVPGDLLVGRQRDGTPLQPWDAEGQSRNNFSFDQGEAHCPFHAHIRKASPRINGPAMGDPQTEIHQRATLFVRRGAVYGIDRLPPRQTLLPEQAKTYLGRDGAAITGGVGLLFMAYMSSIKRQFRVMQSNWFGCPAFPDAKAQLGDPIIRPNAMLRGDPVHEWQWSQRPGSFPLTDFVQTRGGAYFYVPPIPWLKNPPRPSARF